MTNCEHPILYVSSSVSVIICISFHKHTCISVYWYLPHSAPTPEGWWRWGGGSLCSRGISALPNKYLLWERTYGSWHNRALHQLTVVWASLFLFCLLWTHLALQLHFWSIYFSHYLHCHPNNLLIFLTLRGHLCASGRRGYI